MVSFQDDWDVSPMCVREAVAQVYVIVNTGHCQNINDVPMLNPTKHLQAP